MRKRQRHNSASLLLSSERRGFAPPLTLAEVGGLWRLSAGTPLTFPLASEGREAPGLHTLPVARRLPIPVGRLDS